MPLPQEALDAVAHNNVKTIGEALAFLTTESMRNMVAHRDRLDRISEAAIGRIIQNFAEIDPMEAVSTVKALSGNDVAAQLASLLAALASGQQQVKTAQTTPPVTP
jgi:hypothetical protein